MFNYFLIFSIDFYTLLNKVYSLFIYLSTFSISTACRKRDSYFVLPEIKF